MPLVTKPKHPAAAICPVLRSQTWELARAKEKSPKVRRQQALKEKEGVLTAQCCEVGDLVSMDQFVMKTPGRLPSGCGREGHDN